MAAVAALLVVSGWTSGYSEGVMDTVVTNRLRWDHIDPSVSHLGYVVMLDREHLGRTVWMEFESGRIYGPVMVADCAEGKAKAGYRANGMELELSYELQQEIGLPQHNVKVWASDPRRDRLPH